MQETIFKNNQDYIANNKELCDEKNIRSQIK